MAQKKSSMFSRRVHAFCAFCKTPRLIYRKKRMGFFDIAGSALGSLALMGALFQEWNVTGLLFFLVFLGIAEVTTQLRWRMKIVCPHCGFDPVLYLKKPEEAALKVKIRLDQRQDDPAAMMANPLQIPKGRPNPDAPSVHKGRRISRQV